MFDLYTIAWPALFYDKDMLKISRRANPRKWFIEMLKDLSVPDGAEMKFENTKKYFSFIEQEIANLPRTATKKGS
jgi:hypothetical protein